MHFQKRCAADFWGYAAAKVYDSGNKKEAKVFFLRLFFWTKML